MDKKVLELSDYAVSFYTSQGEVEAVRGIDLAVRESEILCVVGESGCGKTVMCQSVLHLLPRYGKIKRGQVRICGEDVTHASEKKMRKLRGSLASMVFQDPLATLNPTIPIGKQIKEAILKHEKISREEADRRALELLRLVGIEDAENRFHLQPHFFSGGMRQRCVLAVALAGKPKLLLADEPTTALDVTIEVKILDLLKEIREKTGVAIVLVTHDLGVVARIADRVAVMYAGKIVEIGTAEDVFYDPRHPYTWGLLSSLPALGLESGRLRSIPGMPPSLIDPPPGDAFAERNEYALAIDYEKMPPMFRVSDTHYAATWLLDERAPKVLPPEQISTKNLRNAVLTAEKDRKADVDADYLIEARGVKQHFRINANLTVKAVDGVSFGIRKGEVFGLVGESGCGKSTIARTLSGIYVPTDGEVLYDGRPVTGKKADSTHRRQMQNELQILFQDSAAALNPRMTVEALISEPFVIRRQRCDRERVLGAMRDVGLEETCLRKYSGELSGGQRQRVALARCIITEPRLIIADEPIASLDISIQAQIVMLCKRLQEEKHFAFLFIAHDLSMIRFISDRVGVMLHGRIVEVAEAGELFRCPLHPYTKSLLSAIHIPDPLLERKKALIHYDTGTRLGETLCEVSPGHYLLTD